MKTDLGEALCAGYKAQKIDFPELHAQLDQETRGVLEVMIEAAATAETFPTGNRFCSIIILGHADRVDTPGLSAEQRRANELENSDLRAQSAEAWFFSQVAERLLAEGSDVPNDLGSLQNVQIWTVACGSADLVHKTPGNDEGKRQQNRRVRFIGTIFTPESEGIPIAG
jgi:outer membrane protein OmpA-like peptidoglycan-associated protein